MDRHHVGTPDASPPLHLASWICILYFLMVAFIWKTSPFTPFFSSLDLPRSNMSQLPHPKHTFCLFFPLVLWHTMCPPLALMDSKSPMLYSLSIHDLPLPHRLSELPTTYGPSNKKFIIFIITKVFRSEILLDGWIVVPFSH